jgi:hypothetical protein
MDTSQANLRRLQIIRWKIYLLVALTVVLPYVVQIPLPFKPSPWAQRLYDRIDALKPGSHVLLALDFDPASKAELEPMSLALLHHCYKKDLVPIVMTHWNSGLGLVKQICEKAAADANAKWGKPRESGRDYVFLGYRPGGSNLVLLMGESIKAAYDKDHYGKPTQGMAALQGVNSLKDIDFAVEVAAGATVEMWIAWGSDRFHFPLGAGTTAVMAPDMYPWLQSNQLVGFLGGLRGAADYESLVDAPGEGTRGMQAQSATHVLLIVLIVGANVRLFAGRFVRRREG